MYVVSENGTKWDFEVTNTLEAIALFPGVLCWENNYSAFNCPIPKRPSLRAMNKMMTKNMYTFAVIAPIKFTFRLIARLIIVEQASPVKWPAFCLSV